ncbi:LysR family transcriptional regulator [Acerihabitans arboris]|uniref:LysR family transcriptional regulator n=1 Tax=Acerihabitans arboris TaxID=2691583 RepID=A0A845SJA7_9GAMM|nr:LysR family transcriptional regulator [Acerihabitans arboris]NDL63452.1 LysR family transcriptional regulator [Acerihabitans arboris]
MKGTEFSELVAFMAILEERSFRRAALRLGLSPSALSHTLRSLEERLGARLLNRTTRSLAPTQAGQALFDRLSPAIADMEGAIRDVGAFQTQPRGRVRINLPRLAARLVVGPALGDFVRTYPDIQLDLVIDDNITDVVAKGFDAGIRLGELVQQDMIAVRLTPDWRMAVVGSPAYFAGRSLPQTPADIREHACINYRWNETGALYRWNFDGPDGPLDVGIEGVITVNEMDLLLEATLQGAGLAFLPESFVADAINQGRLVRALGNWCGPFAGFYLYYPNKPHMPAALRAFIDFIKLPVSPLCRH